MRVRERKFGDNASFYFFSNPRERDRSTKRLHGWFTFLNYAFNLHAVLEIHDVAAGILTHPLTESTEIPAAE